MKTIKEKQLLVGADFAGFPLKEAVVAHLQKKGWTITDVGVKADSVTQEISFTAPALLGPTVYIKVGGTWKQATSVYIRVSGAWKDALVKIKVGGSWK